MQKHLDEQLREIIRTVNMSWRGSKYAPDVRVEYRMNPLTCDYSVTIVEASMGAIRELREMGYDVRMTADGAVIESKFTAETEVA